VDSGSPLIFFTASSNASTQLPVSWRPKTGRFILEFHSDATKFAMTVVDEKKEV
jgi:hypothetical protein